MIVEIPRKFKDKLENVDQEISKQCLQILMEVMKNQADKSFSENENRLIFIKSLTSTNSFFETWINLNESMTNKPYVSNFLDQDFIKIISFGIESMQREYKLLTVSVN